MATRYPENTTETDRSHGPFPDTMFAAVRNRYGRPEDIRATTVPVPAAKPGTILIRVAAAGLDRATWHQLTGLPYVARLFFGLRSPRQPVLGQQVAGEVVEIGPGVTEFSVGERVLGVASGAFAQYALAKTSEAAHQPDGVSDAAAATVGISGLTAMQAVDRAGVQAGQRVLVLGGSGAVGNAAVQLAVSRGAEVTGVASATKLDFMRGLGARSAFDYRATDIAGMGGPFDAIIDIGGNRTVSALQAALTGTGTLVIVGGEEGGRFLLGIQRNLVAAIKSVGSGQRLTSFLSRVTASGCAEVAALIESGAMTPAIDHEVPLTEVGEALLSMGRGAIRGNIVIRPSVGCA